MRRRWHIYLRDTDENQVGSIRAFDTLLIARDWVNKRLAWINRKHYTVDVQRESVECAQFRQLWGDSGRGAKR